MSFFQGTLQEGIATAVQQSKSVVCFVTGELLASYVQITIAETSADKEDESVKWEDEYLTDDVVSPCLGGLSLFLVLEHWLRTSRSPLFCYPTPWCSVSRLAPKRRDSSHSSTPSRLSQQSS